MKICSKGHSYDSARCKICKNAYDKAYQKANLHKYSAYSKKWESKNNQKHKEDMQAWKKANPDKCNAGNARYRAAKLKATPPWLTQVHWVQINEFYSLAKELQWLSDPNDPLQVDHIIPLQGENVSGLHVPWNLQILPKSKNSGKRNRIR